MGIRERDGLSDGKSPTNSGGETDLFEDLQVMPGALYITDGGWRITGLCSDTEEYWRRRNRNPLGAWLWELLPEIEHHPCRKLLEKAMTERRPIRFINTTPFMKTSVEVDAIPISGGGLAVFLHDISEKRRQEETLAYQAYLLSEISDAVISTDNDFCINSWNKAAELIYGWKASEVLGKNADTVFKAEFVGISAAENR
jgi:PAS domain-containing protein